MSRCQKISWRNMAVRPDLASALAAARQTGRPFRTELAPACGIPLRDPSIVLGGDGPAEDFAQRYFWIRSSDTAAIDVVAAPNAAFLTQRSVLLLPDHGLCEELDYENDYSALPDVFQAQTAPWELSAWFEAKLAAVAPLPGVSLIVHPKWHANYTHWHVEALSALLDPKLPRDGVDTVCVPALSAMQAESLSNLDLAPGRVARLSEPAHRFEVALLPTHSLFRTFPHPSVGPPLAAYGAMVRRRYAPDAVTGPPVYLARTDSQIRPMVNEAALCAALEQAGCRIVVASGHSYAEQVRIFAGARGLIGAHGSGLTNMLFLPEGAPVIELRAINAGTRSPLWDRSYHVLASLTEREYGALFFSNAAGTESWEVDIGLVVRIVRARFGLN